MFKKRTELFLFLAPALFFLMTFWVIPIISSIFISFTDWDYMTPDYHFIGFENYRSLLKEKRFYSALFHTAVFALETVIPGILLGLTLALLVQKAGKTTPYPVILFSPWITPAVAVSIVWTWLFEPDLGLLNQLLRLLGLSPQPWLHSSQTALASVALVTVWKNSGYIMLLFMGGLNRIPKELYEASAADGAGSFQRFLKITLPLISPTIGMISIILTVDALRAYDQIQILTQGGPSGSTRTLLYLYYQLGFEQFQMGKAAAAVVILTIMGLSLSLLQSRIGRRRLV